MLLQLVNEKNYASIRFESPDEVRQATLGEPLQFFARRSLYPVEVKQRVASSIIVTQSCTAGEPLISATPQWRAPSRDIANVRPKMALEYNGLPDSCTRQGKRHTEMGVVDLRPAFAKSSDMDHAIPRRMRAAASNSAS